MKYIGWLISAVNLYFGLRCLLNAVGILQTSKYSQATTVIFAVLFLGLGAAGFYLSITKNNAKLGLLIAFGRWVLAALILFITLITRKSSEPMPEARRASIASRATRQSGMIGLSQRHCACRLQRHLRSCRKHALNITDAQ